MVEWIFCNAEFSLFSQTLCDLPGGPIGPGGPGRPGGPVPPKEGGPGGPRDPGVPGVPGSPAQTEDKVSAQSSGLVSFCSKTITQSKEYL